MTTVLVQCTQSKQRRENVPAKQLYRGQLWEAQRRFAETHDQWFILSGKHRVICPDEKISYYEKHISDVDDMNAWAQNVDQRLSGVEGEEIIITAGSEYADPILPLLEAKGIEALEPCRGMKIGERVAWLREQAKARANETLC